MAFVKTHDEASPAGTDNLSSGDDAIRNLSYEYRERGAVDHNAFATESGETNVWCHKKVSCIVSAADPTTEATLGYLYLKTISSNLELFFKDGAGNVLQMTSAGSLVGTTAFRSGDFILSETTAARSGWSDMSATYEDKFIRLSSGTALDTGGADTHTHTAGSYAAANHTHTVPASSAIWGATTATAGKLSTTGTGNTVDYSATTAASTSSAGAATVTGSSASANNFPAYVQMHLWRKD